jgi:hypothetical protein
MILAERVGEVERLMVELKPPPILLFGLLLLLLLYSRFASLCIVLIAIATMMALYYCLAPVYFQPNGTRALHSFWQPWDSHQVHSD